MRYNGTKFSDEEAAQIRHEAAWHLRLPDPESGARRSDRRDAGIIYKTIDDARVPRARGIRFNNNTR